MLGCLSQCFGWSERGGPSLQNGLRPVCADGVMGFKTHISCAGMLELCPLSCPTHVLLFIMYSCQLGFVYLFRSSLGQVFRFHFEGLFHSAQLHFRPEYGLLAVAAARNRKCLL